MTFSLRFHAHSEVGRIRKNNQDSAYASPTMLLVADGMGGAAAGDLASAVATVTAQKLDRAVPADDMLEFIGGVVVKANDRLLELIEEDPTLDGMGTTFCGASFDGQYLALAHIGDSRMYRLRGDAIEQLTHDHSWVQTLIDEGRLTPEQAATHPHRSLILKVLNGQTEPDPDYQLLEVSKGDRYLFCSDGLSGLIDDDHIQRLASIEDLEEASLELAKAANQAGGHDNITVVLAEVVDHDDDLAAAAAVVVGSATEREVPQPGELASRAQSAGDGYPVAEERDVNAAETARYAPETRKVRWPSAIIALVLVLAVIGGAIWSLSVYGQGRYFIAEADGNVAIYNGLPGSLLGYELNTLEERRETVITDLPRYYQRAVRNTIGAANLNTARETVDQLEQIAEECVATRNERRGHTPPPATPSPNAAPNDESQGSSDYPTLLGPVTPTATEEADPEAC